MSGYIINPYSADFKRTVNLSYSIESIPIVAYGLIGITTLTLAYLTFVESAGAASKSATEGISSVINSTTKSATSLLPTGFLNQNEPKPTQSSILPPMNNVAPAPAQPGVTGGKSRHRKSNKKNTKRITHKKK